MSVRVSSFGNNSGLVCRLSLRLKHLILIKFFNFSFNFLFSVIECCSFSLKFYLSHVSIIITYSVSLNVDNVYSMLLLDVDYLRMSHGRNDILLLSSTDKHNI